MFYSEASHTLEIHFPVRVRNANPQCGEKLGRSVRNALLRAAAVHPYERTDGGEESARRSGTNPAGAATAAADSGVQGAGGRSG